MTLVTPRRPRSPTLARAGAGPKEPLLVTSPGTLIDTWQPPPIGNTSFNPGSAHGGGDVYRGDITALPSPHATWKEPQTLMFPPPPRQSLPAPPTEGGTQGDVTAGAPPPPADGRAVFRESPDLGPAVVNHRWRVTSSRHPAGSAHRRLRLRPPRPQK
ncbi:protein transport protein SEC31-like [Mesocricetus auratus]|uniref:Protein transport protein SEC31-like n=1 Tax=Mesocricetus auratus TaxID=10036 RepID=A0ABM2X353_MESAU|nr:protein transport protein SEC31-like [Mesocricetus auratus]